MPDCHGPSGTSAFPRQGLISGGLVPKRNDAATIVASERSQANRRRQAALRHTITFMEVYVMMKSALVCGAGGFIGSHLVKRLKREGFWVRGVDLKFPGFSETEADDFIITDLRQPDNCRHVVDRKFGEVY